jgi:hypothetical protein
MGIDPEILSRQRRRLSIVPRNDGKCGGCGKPTGAKSGVCTDCQNGRTVARWTTPKLVAVRAEIDEELRRRRAEIDAALEVKP